MSLILPVCEKAFGYEYPLLRLVFSLHLLDMMPQSRVGKDQFSIRHLHRIARDPHSFEVRGHSDVRSR